MFQMSLSRLSVRSAGLCPIFFTSVPTVVWPFIACNISGPVRFRRTIGRLSSRGANHHSSWLCW